MRNNGQRMMLREISISVTERCNLRCLMCNIWNKEQKVDLDIRLLENLPASLHSVAITGGEPFLRQDIPLIVRKIKKSCPRARIVITTNGTPTEVIAQDIKEMLACDPKIALRISVDGEETIHDKIRGCAGAYQRTLRTVSLLKQAGVRDVDIHITLTNDNIDQLQGIYRLACKNNFKFNCQVAHSAPVYFAKENEPIRNRDLLQSQLETILQRELKTFDIYRLYKAYYYKGIWDHMRKVPYQRQCSAGLLFCYIDAKGDVYPCILQGKILGNLRDSTLSEIIGNEKARTEKEAFSCLQACWLTCTVAPDIKQQPLSVLGWVLVNKCKAHVHMPII